MRSPHWNTKLHTLWRAMQKARRASRRSGLGTDINCYREKRESFKKENRRFKRIFARKTESRIREGDNNLTAGPIKADATEGEGEKADSAERPPVSYLDQEQDLVELQQFIAPKDLVNDIKRSIKRSRQNKAPGRDGLHN